MSESINPDIDRLDVTDRVEVYRKGKTFECDCGHGIGTGLNQKVIKCNSCGTMCVDERAAGREPPELDETQSTLGDW